MVSCLYPGLSSPEAQRHTRTDRHTHTHTDTHRHTQTRTTPTHPHTHTRARAQAYQDAFVFTCRGRPMVRRATPSSSSASSRRCAASWARDPKACQERGPRACARMCLNWWSLSQLKRVLQLFEWAPSSTHEGSRRPEAASKSFTIHWRLVGCDLMAQLLAELGSVLFMFSNTSS